MQRKGTEMGGGGGGEVGRNTGWAEIDVSKLG